MKLQKLLIAILLLLVAGSSCAATVNDSIFERVDDASALKAGDIITFAGTYKIENLGGYWFYTIGDQNKTCFKANRLEILDSLSKPSLTKDEAKTYFTLGGEKGKWTFRLPQGVYLYPGGSEKYLTIKPDVSTPSTASITIQDRFATIKFNTYGNNLLAYYKNTFTCLKEKNPGAEIIIYRLVKPAESISSPVNVTISNIGYASLYYSDRALQIPKNVTAYTYQLVNDNLTVSCTYNAGEVIPKGEAVILHAPEGNYTFTPVQSDKQLDPMNILKGYDKDTQILGNGNILYELSTKGKDPKSIGFYWGSYDGKSLSCAAHKVYFEMPQSTAAKQYLLNRTANGIQAYSTLPNNQDMPTYNLYGMRVGSDYHGIIIRNGKKYVK
jgi:hypothetical protein